jgi:hypothetical protein
MLKFLKEFFEFRKMKKERVMSCKKFVISQTLIKYFTDLQGATAECDLPPFIKAQNIMSTLKTDKQINKMYKTLEFARLV